MPYTYSLPQTPSFIGEGLRGFDFGPLGQKRVEVSRIEVTEGHDTFIISRKITRTYYVVEGAGYFIIAGEKYPVGPDTIVEVPPRVEFSYSGKMTLILLSQPRWFRNNDKHTRWNPDVTGPRREFGAEPWLSRIGNQEIFGRSPVRTFLRLNQKVWDKLPAALTLRQPIRCYGRLLNLMAQTMTNRQQAFTTYFLRNRAELKLISRLLDGTPGGATIRVAVLGCSTGPEAYSVAWKIRSARPDLKLVLHAADISGQAIECARQGIYSSDKPQLTRFSVCAALGPAEIDEIFEHNPRTLQVRAHLKEGIHWHVGDACDPELASRLGPQDMVVANNFLCHMRAPAAEKCLLNVATLVRPGGHVFVSGVDLGVRARVAKALQWEPLEDLLEEIHEDDRRFGSKWPCQYAALEPLNKGRCDWRLRYAAAFRTPIAEPAEETGETVAENSCCSTTAAS